MKKEDENKWREELNDAPNLSGLSGADPFKAPEGYFDNFSASVADRINATNNKPVFSLSALLRKPAVTLPVLAVVIAGLIWIVNRKDIDHNQEFISMNYDDIYNSGLVNDLDESIMVEYIEVETAIQNTSEEEMLLESISEESLINEL